MSGVTKNGSKWTLALCAILLVCLGALIEKYAQSPLVIRPRVLRESGYQYIAPVLLCNVDSNQPTNRDTGLENKVRTYLSKTPEYTVSTYLLQLSSGGKWAGVNENESFAPASMLKVPAMLAILKYADTHPDFLSRQILFKGVIDNNQAEYFKPQKSITPGNYYTIEELLSYMITYSDNNAVELLSGSIDSKSLMNIYIDLGITLPADATVDINFMSPKTYSLFLRVLFNSTYLTRESSEKALALMSTSNFPQGLLAGVPASVKVAQKFGEREVYTQQKGLSYRELHNCGIVYKERSPYILCVMTRGNDFSAMTKIISDISKMTYNHLNTTSTN